MTKLRPPLSFEGAMTRVAGRIGWPKAVEITGQADRTLRNWSDPDTSAAVTLDKALALDVAYLAQGGDVAPFFEVYRARLEADVAIATGCLTELKRKIGTVAKEGGEAIAYALAAAEPGACDKVLARAELELQESAEATTSLLADVRNRRTGKTAPPEVAPPVAVA